MHKDFIAVCFNFDSTSEHKLLIMTSGEWYCSPFMILWKTEAEKIWNGRAIF